MQNETVSSKARPIDVKDTAISGLFIAMVFIATMFINIRLPISVNGGLIHFGNVILFTISIVFGKRKGAVAGAFGMCLFDIVSGWTPWAPFTFIIRGVMGYMTGSIANSRGRDGKSFVFNLLAVIVSGIWMLAGYYIAEVILYGNWLTPLTSVPGNIAQLVLGLLSLALVPILKQINFSR